MRRPGQHHLHIIRGPYRALRADSRPVALRPWLFAIARNDCLTILRKRRPVLELAGEPAGGTDPFDQLELREELRQVLEGLRCCMDRRVWSAGWSVAVAAASHTLRRTSPAVSAPR